MKPKHDKKSLLDSLDEDHYSPPPKQIKKVKEFIDTPKDKFKQPLRNNLKRNQE